MTKTLPEMLAHLAEVVPCVPHDVRHLAALLMTDTAATDTLLVYADKLGEAATEAALDGQRRVARELAHLRALVTQAVASPPPGARPRQIVPCPWQVVHDRHGQRPAILIGWLVDDAGNRIAAQIVAEATLCHPSNLTMTEETKA
jgi:hypothetical protein